MIDKQPGLWIYPDGRSFDSICMFTSQVPRPPSESEEKSMILKTSGLWVYPSGREVIQTKTLAGRAILAERRMKAWRDSMGLCCLCRQTVQAWDETLEHKTSKGSGGGKHDDRQNNLGISHLHGNIAKGSMSLEQYLKLPLDVRVRNCK